MDPVTHTLVGATIAEAAFRKRTRLATLTLVIAANAPDVDVVAYAWGNTTALWFRRGLTHGVMALTVLPFLVVGAVWLLDRVRRGHDGRPPLSLRVLLAAAFVGVWTHPVLDFLNVYGMRWLTPFAFDWTYGDVLFILDPWLLIVLTIGVTYGRRRAQRSIAWVTLSLVVTYVGLTGASTILSRSIVRRQLTDAGVSAERILVGPVFGNPFRRFVLAQSAGAYRVGRFTLGPTPRLTLDSAAVSIGDAHPAVGRARSDKRARQFLSWSRFPYFRVDEVGGRLEVSIFDARYTLSRGGEWASVRVAVGGR